MVQTAHIQVFQLEVMVQTEQVSVTVAGAVTAVTVTTAGTGYTFGTISNAQIVAAGATNLVRCRIRCNYSNQKVVTVFNAVEELGGFL